MAAGLQRSGPGRTLAGQHAALRSGVHPEYVPNKETMSEKKIDIEGMAWNIFGGTQTDGRTASFLRYRCIVTAGRRTLSG
jgi:hypothetical protein